ncbi:MAG: lysylphosphatidylglycerol synthase transmembrane domain-containing protein [Anaerolineaceae bacterium]
MNSSATKPHKKNQILRWLLPIAITFIAFYFIAKQVRFEDLKSAFSMLKGHTWQTLGVLLGVYVVSMSLRALAIKLILGKNFDFKTAFFSMNAGYLLNNFLPFRLGEVGRGLLLTGEGKNKAPFYKVFASVFTERVLDIFISASLFLLTISVAVTSQTLRTVVWVAWILMIVMMVVIAILSKHKNPFFSWYQKKLGTKPFWMNKVLPKLASFLEGFEVLAEPKKLAAIFGVLALSWMLSLAEFYYLQRMLLPNGQWWWPAFVLSATAFASALPSAPGSLGVYEAAMVSAYLVLGVDQAPALTMAVILHVYQFVLSSLFGLIGLERLGENIGSLASRSSRRQEIKEE